MLSWKVSILKNGSLALVSFLFSSISECFSQYMKNVT